MRGTSRSRRRSGVPSPTEGGDEVQLRLPTTTRRLKVLELITVHDAGHPGLT